jgi:hypothetical protein
MAVLFFEFPGFLLGSSGHRTIRMEDNIVIIPDPVDLDPAVPGFHDVCPCNDNLQGKPSFFPPYLPIGLNKLVSSQKKIATAHPPCPGGPLRHFTKTPENPDTSARTGYPEENPGHTIRFPRNEQENPRQYSEHLIRPGFPSLFMAPNEFPQ